MKKHISAILFFASFAFMSIALNSCVTTESTDANGVVTKTRRMDTEAAKLIAPLFIPRAIPQVEYSK